jgi:hypothetical protein
MPANSGVAAYISWTLDATGRGWVDKAGVTKLGLRDGSDALDHFTSGLTGADKWNAMSLLYSDATGTANDPKLVVVHSASASGPSNLKSYNTNLKANIKSYNTNLIANIKSINTNV